jgi:hypothetical protein
MAKSLNDILKGVKKSTIAPPDINDKNFYQWNAKDGVKFIDKHKIEKHEDRVGNGDDVYNGKTKKTTKYKFQKDAVYEESNCNHTMEGTHCPMHEKAACPTEDDVNMQPKPKKDSKGREYLADKKKCMDEGRIEDDAQRRAAKKLSDIAKTSNVPVTKLKPGKKSYNQIKSTGQMFGGARQFAAGLSKRDIESGDHGSSVGKAKLKEEEISEVAPPNPKIEKWINSNKERFVKEYGKEKGMQVLYAKAWKMHGQSESGTSSPATNTDYAGPGAAGWSTGRLDVGTL